MDTTDIIKSKLNFLIEDYKFIFEYNNISGNHYVFKNKNGYIDFYEWKQFDESAIFVNYNMLSKKINLIEEYPQKVGKFHFEHKGLKWFFKDERLDYWEMISDIIKTEITIKNTIFGLPL